MLALPNAWAQDDDTEAVPKPRRYTVEIIVFAYAENVSVGTEVFPPDEVPVPADGPVPLDMDAGPGGVAIDADGNPIPTFTDVDRANDDALDEALATDSGLALLSMEPVLMIDDDFSMQSALERLQRLDAYQPIMHTGWTQATLPLEESVALELAYFGAIPDGLEGSFMLYLGRYLHLVVDLSLDGPVSNDEKRQEFREPARSFGDERLQFETAVRPKAGAIRYRIQEDRILKNGDVRYFDHPKFGVLAKVTRVEEEEEEPEIEADPDSA